MNEEEMEEKTIHREKIHSKVGTILYLTLIDCVMACLPLCNTSEITIYNCNNEHKIMPQMKDYRVYG
jgi:hypothetical protein